MTPSRKHGRPSLLALIAALALAGTAPAAAQDADKATPIQVEADRMEHDDQRQTAIATGHVKITHGNDLTIFSDRAVFHKDSNRIEASGNIRIQRNKDLFTGEELKLDTERDQGTLQPAAMDLDGPGGRGDADSAVRRDKDRFTLFNAEMTNCDCDDPPWVIKSAKVDVDMEANQATGEHVTLYIHGLPIAYTPWFRQPVKKVRQSGFLIPYAKVSGSNGLEIDIPYYWNIAPERDATFTLHPTSKRGVLAKGQYRYLAKNHEGTFDIQGLNDSKINKNRGLLVWDHFHDLGKWDFKGRLERSETADFINDFDQDLVDGSATMLESHALFSRGWTGAESATDLQIGTRWYQDLIKGSDATTVQRLPFAHLTDTRALLPEQTDLSLESGLRFDNFYQKNGDATQRIDAQPILTHYAPLPIGGLTSAVSVRETAYAVQKDPEQASVSDESSHNRESAFASLKLDGVLAKSFKTGEGNKTFGAFKHTIEPSVQPVVHSSTRQADLPDYDANLNLFTTKNLFSQNLYAGADRVSAANWVNYGVTTNLFAKKRADGRVERLASVTIGQRWAPRGHRDYQRNEEFSDVVAGLQLKLTDRLGLDVETRSDPHEEEVRTADANATYTNDRKDTFTFGYHFIGPGEPNEAAEEAIARTDIRLTRAWRWRQEADYSLEEDRFKSWKTGLVYQHDCWELQLLGGRRLSAATADHGGGFIGFFITLRGLGGYGINN